MEAPGGSWDFSAALKLLSSSTLIGLGSGAEDTSASQISENDPFPPNSTSSLGSLQPISQKSEQSLHSLGTFDKVWDFLGIEGAHGADSPPSHTTYASVEAIHPTSQAQNHDGSPVLQELSDGAGTLNHQTLFNSDALPSPSSKLEKKLRKKNALAESKDVIKARSSQKAFTTVGATPKGNRSDDEARRRRIMLELSQKPTASPQKGSRRLGYASDLVPSSVATRKPLHKATKSSMLDDHDLSDFVRKTAHLMTLIRNRFPNSHALNRYYSSVIDGIDVGPGIHVFVDISNILIGFHDTLKLRRGLHPNSRMKRQTLSFYNFSLVLERGRPVAKKLLAGSDTIDSIEEAQRLGYTTHILARVEKPERENGYTATSDSEPMPLSRKVRKGEQAVDEILQLHILNSILDCEEPSTIVLASGDAAQGEFGDGFLKAVERGLRAGWKVEVVAWRANISSAYRNAGWTSRWKSSFRLIELDDFAELLHVERN